MVNRWGAKWFFVETLNLRISSSNKALNTNQHT